jgi:hypothetical protein
MRHLLTMHWRSWRLYFVSQIILNYEEGYCEKRENNYKPIWKMIVGKHEMSLRFIIAHICIVIGLYYQYITLYSIDLRLLLWCIMVSTSFSAFPAQNMFRINQLKFI